MAKQVSIEFIVDERIKNQLVKAAEAYGMDLSTFVVAAAQMQAERVLRLSQPITLSNDESDKFVSALQRPARVAPESVRKAIARHSKLIKKRVS